MLSGRVPLRAVRGLFVANAHRVAETSAEAFIVRLYRAENKEGFVRGFSDRPQAMASGFNRAERVMKALLVRRLYLWPRFQLGVAAALEEHPPHVIDIRVPLTPAISGAMLGPDNSLSAAAIQAAIVEVMDACLRELKKTNKLDIEELTVENGLFKSFDEDVRRQLDPVWHTIGRKAKQLVADLKTLRKLAEYLLRYDAVTFLRYLDALRISEGMRAIWIYAEPTHRMFEIAKKRVYQVVRADSVAALLSCEQELGSKAAACVNGTSNSVGVSEPSSAAAAPANGDAGSSALDVEVELVLEEMPKWKVLREVLEEIQVDQERTELEQRVRSSAEASTSTHGSVGTSRAVLVACKDERMCLQLEAAMSRGAQTLMRDEWDSYLLSKADLLGMRTRAKRSRPRGGGGGSSRAAVNGLQPLSRGQSQENAALLAAARQVRRRGSEVISLGQIDDMEGDSNGRRRRRQAGRGGSGAAKRLPVDGDERQSIRGRGSGKRSGRGRRSGAGGTAPPSEGNAEAMGKEVVVAATRSGPEQEWQVLRDGATALPAPLTTAEAPPFLAPCTASSSVEPPVPEPGRPLPLAVHYHALESDLQVLEEVAPSYVVIYDPDMEFVRELEVYHAQRWHKEGAAGSADDDGRLQPIKVYFLFYEGSTEARKFEASIRKESEAFESLIKAKAIMMIPVDQERRAMEASPHKTPPMTATGVSLNINSRKGGIKRAAEQRSKVVVDMREFNSSLPAVLHQQGMSILPVTLEIGDYVLSPEICIERKSVSDLFGSFASGRLYHQADALTRHYKLPVLLIEFSQDKSFSLQAASDVGDDITPNSIISKMCLLALHFPRLRTVWSRSLHATADIFAELKANQDEPDSGKAMRVGVPTEAGLIEGDIRDENFNTTAVELLRRLPGVTDANYRSLVDGCESLADLAQMPIEGLAALMGARPAKTLRDFLDAKCPTLL
eukprot:SM000201S05925  [mRNA]  locus=s201:168274:173629:+ [translate_table: standard]